MNQEFLHTTKELAEERMYSPVKDGVEKTVRSVRYTEAKPPSHLSALIHCFWELKTEGELPEDFCLHALPDACVNILFNQVDTKIAGITALRTTFEVLNLGRTFHYVGIQFFPGVWQGDPKEIALCSLQRHRGQSCWRVSNSLPSRT